MVYDVFNSCCSLHNWTLVPLFPFPSWGRCLFNWLKPLSCIKLLFILINCFHCERHFFSTSMGTCLILAKVNLLEILLRSIKIWQDLWHLTNKDIIDLILLHANPSSIWLKRDIYQNHDVCQSMTVESECLYHAGLHPMPRGYLRSLIIQTGSSVWVNQSGVGAMT